MANEIIVLLDFAESYSFLVQEAVQGYHWENSQATLRPFSVYFKNDVGEVKCLSICIIHDSMKHNSLYIYPQCAHLYTRKASNSFQSTVVYFSDGASSQYSTITSRNW